MEKDDKLPFLAAGDEVAFIEKNEDEYLVLMVGNSITRHGTSPEILEKYGWDHVSGMAASCEEKDYAHLLARKIQETMPDKKVRLVFQGAGNEEQFKKVRDLSLRPDLIVFQCGEHVTNAAVPQFEQMYTQTIECFRESHPEAKIITIAIWNPCCYEEFTTCTGPNYSENAKLINAVQKRVSTKFGIPFADVSPYENDPVNTGTGMCAPVRWHPNDNGMSCYANTAFEAFLELKLMNYRLKYYLVDIDGTLTYYRDGSVAPEKLLHGNFLFPIIRDLMVECGWRKREAEDAIYELAERIIFWDYTDFIAEFGLPAAEAFGRMRTWHRENLLVYSETVALIKRLADEGKTLFIMSNNPYVGCMFKLQAAGLADDDFSSPYFRRVFGTNILRGCKCVPDVWKRALAQIPADSNEVGVIGDNPKEDREVPRALGITDTIIIPRAVVAHGIENTKKQG